MSVLFRKHRGSLSDSMETVIEIDSFQSIVALTTEELSHYGIVPKPESFHIKYYCEDKRIGWHTYLIELDGYGVVGFTNGMIE